MSRNSTRAPDRSPMELAEERHPFDLAEWLFEIELRAILQGLKSLALQRNFCGRP
jgi:hypothetical protein